MFDNYKHLGFNSPYYFIKNNKFEIFKSFPEAIRNFDGTKSIDPVAVIELLNNNFVLGDRTLIEGIKLSPWLCKPNKTNESWICAELPKHDTLDIVEETIANELFKRLCKEIIKYIGKKQKVGLLLSGGMDSRMAAGALDFLIKSGQLPNLDVIALTWGNDNTRDVVYAKEIAKRLGWKWKQYKVAAKDLWNNILVTAEHGCIFSPIDLHGIPQIIRDNLDLEIIIAGSYGDSIGRAEYFGWKIKNVPEIRNSNRNLGSIIIDNAFDEYTKYISLDIDNFHALYPTKDIISKKEYDLQAHYMRKMLNPCLGLLESDNTKFCQVFTDPDIYTYMWKISVDRRSDNIYKHMQYLFPTSLEDIPWARTGRKYGDDAGTADSLLKDHHNYISITRDELLGKIEDKIMTSKLFSLNLFNKNSLKHLLQLEHKYDTRNLLYLNKLSWIAALSIMIEDYGISSTVKKYPEKNHYIKIYISFWETVLRKKYGPLVKKIIQA